ncbi:MAG: hypothetical protein MJ252_20675, partial [archaeon]|nr:hypothetical protein [archaeon]
ITCIDWSPIQKYLIVGCESSKFYILKVNNTYIDFFTFDTKNVFGYYSAFKPKEIFWNNEGDTFFLKDENQIIKIEKKI